MSHSRIARSYRGSSFVYPAVLAAVLLMMSPVTRADTVTSGKNTLHGKITAVSSAGITFEPDDSTGAVAIKWKNLQDVQSDGPFHVLYGEDEEQTAPLRGLRNGQLQIGSTSIDTASIIVGQPVGTAGLSWQERMRSNWRYWHGSLDAGLNLQRSTSDSTGFVFAFRTIRSKAPTRLILGAGYRYGTEKADNQPKHRTFDQLVGLVRGEYDFTPRVYGYASGDATYDGIQRLSIRGVPKAGVGYIFWDQQLDESRRNFLQGDVGGSWVYEKYFGGADSDYFAVALGAQAGYYFLENARFDWRLDYLPAVDDFTGDYLLRNEIGVSVPLFGPFNGKFGLLDEYDSTPAPGAKYNSLFLTIGASVVW